MFVLEVVGLEFFASSSFCWVKSVVTAKLDRVAMLETHPPSDNLSKGQPHLH